MRRIFLAAIAICLLSLPSYAGRIDTGLELVNACKDYLAKGAAQDSNVARAPHPCRTFLQGFFVSLVEREKARQDAMIKGIPYSSKERCVRLPDVLTYTDMAQRLINFAQFNPPSLQGPAATLAQQTLERDFPCPATPGR
ncbi:MAG: Rap1a/Tai family immunity protein [Micropepsaceae bacterium]